MSNQYWEKRALLIENEAFKNTEYHLQKIKEQYEVAKENIKKEISKFYEDFAINNQIKLADAKRILNNNELKEFKTTLKQYEKLVKEGNEELLQKIENISIKQRITRLQSLQEKMDIIIDLLNNNRIKEIDSDLYDILENTYYRNLYEIEKQTQIHTDFTLLNEKIVDSILTYNWSGVTYSERIWRNQTEVKEKLKDALNKNFIQGNSINELAAEMSRILDTNYKNCTRLLRTEVNYINNRASIEAYKEKAIKQYEFVAVLDLRTSEICADMDGIIINVKDLVTGVNCPPLHPNCRSTVIPHIEGLERNRVARNPETGKTEEVGNLSYKEWYNKYVDKEEGIIDNFLNKRSNTKLTDITKEKDNIINEAFTNENIKNITIRTNIKSIKLGSNNSYHQKGNIVLKRDYNNHSVRHEIAHAVDYNNNWLSSTKSFVRAIKLDKQYILNNQDLYKKLIKENSNYRELSDIISGITNNKIKGNYFHKNSYWKKSNKLEREIFAQMFTVAGADDFEQLQIFQKYLTNTFKAFDDLIRRIL